MHIPLFQDRFFTNTVRKEANEAFADFLKEGQYILGKQLERFEMAFLTYQDIKHAYGVANGTDGLTIALKSIGIGLGDKVAVPTNTFIAVPLAVLHAGATPVFVDADPASMNIDVQHVKKEGVKALIAVHMYGGMCDMHAIMDFAKEYGINVIEDFSQAHGASFDGQKAGTFGDIGVASLYPTKPLGGLGDGGVVVTNDNKTAAFIKQYRNYGETKKSHYAITGVNSRLDELQAYFLQLKLDHLDELNEERRSLARTYKNTLTGVGDLVLPDGIKEQSHANHLYVIQTEERDALKAYLEQQGITTGIHYPVPCHLQKAFSELGHSHGDFPVAEQLSKNVLSLPLFNGMSEAEQMYVVEKVVAFY